MFPRERSVSGLAALVCLRLGRLAFVPAALIACASSVAHAAPAPQQCGPGDAGWPWKASSPREVAAFPSALIPRRDGTVLVCGGDKRVGGATKVCEVWDPDSDTWAMFPTDMPFGLYAPIGVELDDLRVLVCQGTDSGPESATDLCYLYNPGDDAWTTIAGPGISDLGAALWHLVQRPDGRVQLLPSYHSNNYARCGSALLDLNTMSWTGYGCDGTNTVSGGGDYGAILGNDDVMYATINLAYSWPGKYFDAAELAPAWKLLPAAPVQRSNAISIPALDGGVIVGGGRQQVWDSSFYSRTAERLDPNTHTWVASPPWPYFTNLFSDKVLPIGTNRSLLWVSGQGAGGGTNDISYGFYTYLADHGEWGRTCNESMAITNEAGNPSTTGFPNTQDYMVASVGQDGRVFSLLKYDAGIPVRVFMYDPHVTDADDDSVPDCCDNCPNDFNPLQTDSNQNKLGDLCEVCGDGTLALPPQPQSETIDLVAVRFIHTYPGLARVGSEITVRLTVATTTFVRYLHVVDAIPAGTTLTSAVGSNEFLATEIGANTSVSFEYKLRMPAAKGFIAGTAQVTVEPLELSRESFGIPLTILAFQSEQCDLGARISADGCNASCEVETGWRCPSNNSNPDGVPKTVGCAPICGDGLVTGDEGCDDGNTDYRDGCSARYYASQGSYQQQPYYFDYCANLFPIGADAPGWCQGCQPDPGFVCPEAGKPCHALCGDGLTVGTEACDDGNTDAGDGCGASCQIEPGWDCYGHYDCAKDANGATLYRLIDSGPEQLCGQQFFHDACMPACGDGVKKGDETCDDGNNDGDDGCSARNSDYKCAREYADGLLDAGCMGCQVEPGWDCSSGTCGAICGDGNLLGDEACDDGNTDDGDGCSAGCRIEDGFYCPSIDGECGWVCDEPLDQWGDCNADDHYACKSPHTIGCVPICGDGEIHAPETCDDGNTDSGDGCSGGVQSAECVTDLVAVDAGTMSLGDVPAECLGCRAEPGYTCDGEGCAPVCGDGVVTAGEDCDDGNDQAGDGCNNACAVEDGWYCPTRTDCTFGGLCGNVTVICYPICGDHIIVGDETCDDGNNAWNDGCSGRDVSALCADQLAELRDGLRERSAVLATCFGCRTEVCADGFHQSNEGCDDGNKLEGDGCDSGCNVEPNWTCVDVGPTSRCGPTCGDGKLMGHELCDDGNGESGDGCSDTCRPEIGFVCEGVGPCHGICGDGFQVYGEGCDDGNTDAGDGCSPGCTVESGYSCSPNGGSWVSVCCDANDACSLVDEGDCSDACVTCETTVTPDGPSECWVECGDGARGGGEECDDGNDGNGDGCNNDCELEPGWSCPPAGGVCYPTCGDEIRIPPEACDDGNTDQGDGCSADCSIEIGWHCAHDGLTCGTQCGDGFARGEEACDDGNFKNGDGCSTGCEVEDGFACPPSGGACVDACGDGALEGDEECDDGNRTTGDGCSRKCLLEEGWACDKPGVVCTTVCGDGIIAGGEHCDDGNSDDDDGCDATCQREFGWVCGAAGTACETICGDGIVRGDEACDDGDQIADNGCDTACASEAGWVCPPGGGHCESTCGNGAIDDFEECDDANQTAGDGCDAQCQAEPGFVCVTPGEVCETICGDGLREKPEHCDDGNVVDGDGCSETCQVEAGWECPSDLPGCRPRCGDGIVVGGETCDDGRVEVAGAGEDGCSASCQIEPGWECPTPGALCVRGPSCGNHIIEHGEACDDGNTESGDGCSASCTLEVPTGHAVCGNGVVEAGEVCDDANTRNGDACSATCTEITTNGLVASGGAGCAGGELGASGGAAWLALALAVMIRGARRRRS